MSPQGAFPFAPRLPLSSSPASVQPTPKRPRRKPGLSTKVSRRATCAANGFGPAPALVARSARPSSRPICSSRISSPRPAFHVGPFGVGEQTVRTSDHVAWRSAADAAAIQWGYGSRSIFSKAGVNIPYLVATVSKGIITALQVTGPAPAKGYSFNHIDLGAPIDTLVQYFGPAPSSGAEQRKGAPSYSTYGLPSRSRSRSGIAM